MFQNNIQGIPSLINDEETFLAFTTQLSRQASNGATTNTIEKNSVTFEYKVSEPAYKQLLMQSHLLSPVKTRMMPNAVRYVCVITRKAKRCVV